MFPVDDPEITDQFFDAVDGLLTGRYRIVEYFRGRGAVKAELQAPDDDDWKVLAKWATLRLPFARMTRNVLMNRTLDTTPSPRDTPT